MNNHFIKMIPKIIDPMKTIISQSYTLTLLHPYTLTLLHSYTLTLLPLTPLHSYTLTLLQSYTLTPYTLTLLQSDLKIRHRGWGPVKVHGGSVIPSLTLNTWLGILVSCGCLLLSIIPSPAVV